MTTARTLFLLLAPVIARTPLPAQDAVPLAVGRRVEGALTADAVRRYSLTLPASRFVIGEVDQLSVDAVITIFAPDGRRIAAFDGPARGPDPFVLRAESAGTYRIEVTPYQREEGRYAILVRSVEPFATTPEGRADQAMAPFAGPDRPGGVVAVTRGGRIVFARGYGLANVEDTTPNTPSTVYHMASVSKQFTAFAIAMLADQGRLALDDDVRRWIPELPDYGRTVTLRHLLTHTGGVRDQWELWGMAGGRLDDVIRHEELLRLVLRQRELNFDPGSRYLYSNAGYTLLAEVVARVSGQAYPAWMREHVFTPLGMTQTQVYDDHQRIVPGRAYSFRHTADGLEKSVLSYANMGATSLFTTAEDLARWLRNWRTGEVGGTRVLAMMQERGVLASGDTIPYALGVVVDRQRGLARISHSGADAGYRTFLAYYPALDAGVVTLGNSAGFDAAGVAAQVAQAFFGDAMTAPASGAAPGPAPAAGPASRPEPWRPDSAALAAYAGRWYSDELEAVYTLVVRDGRLVARHRRHGDLPLTPVERDAFTAGQWFIDRVRFERDPSGTPAVMRLSSGRALGVRFARMP